jgi:membrane-associated phospholipid phosphatase
MNYNYLQLNKMALLDRMNQRKYQSHPLQTNIPLYSSQKSRSKKEIPIESLRLSSLMNEVLSVGPIPHDQPKIQSDFSTYRSEQPPDRRKFADLAADVPSDSDSSSPPFLHRAENYEKTRSHKITQNRFYRAKKYKHDPIYLRPREFESQYIDAYTKGLPHNQGGYVDPIQMKKLLQSISKRDRNKLNKVKLGSKDVRLVDPSAAWSSDIIGSCNNSYRYSKLPKLSSDKMTAQILELYAMTLCRDISFCNYHLSSIISDCCQGLNHLKSYPQVQGKVKFNNIFRGPMYGDLQGPYISQFLYLDVPIGGFTQKQKYNTPLEGYNFMTTWEQAISVQNGVILESPSPRRDIPRYIITGRDLAELVHHDEPYQFFYNTCIILMGLKAPLNPGIQRLLSENSVEGFFVNFGKPDIQSTMNLIGRNALLAAWYIKWNTLFLRPEEFGIELERSKGKSYRQILENRILKDIKSRFGTSLLPQAYPEGSPYHPSYPAGHAAIAGACVTVLKFFFDSNYELNIYEPDSNGLELIKSEKKTTVGNELNKLASNIGLGRAWAGIHYQMDVIAGLKLGEKVAINCLQELIHRYPMSTSITFTRFNETSVTISNS